MDSRNVWIVLVCHMLILLVVLSLRAPEEYDHCGLAVIARELQLV